MFNASDMVGPRKSLWPKPAEDLLFHGVSELGETVLKDRLCRVRRRMLQRNKLFHKT